MSHVFTEYLRSLEPEVDPDPQLLDEVLKHLRRTLVRELKRRGLYHAPPTYCGIYGYLHWWDGDALDELLLDCYVFIFGDRLRALKSQLKIKDNVDGYVVLNVRHFVQDVQATNDPLGAKTFRVLRKATRRLVDGGTLRILAGDPRIRNDTLLGFSSRVDSESPRDELAEHVRTWCDDLLPDLVTATGRGMARILAGLQDHVVELRDRGFEAFRFQDLLRPLRNDVRSRCSLAWVHPEEDVAVEGDGGGLVERIRTMRPENSFEARESFRALLRCVARSIHGVAKTRKSEAHLLAYWRFLVDLALGRTEDDAHPSDLKLSRLLEIPRDRFNELRDLLGRLIEGCHSGYSEKVAVN